MSITIELRNLGDNNESPMDFIEEKELTYLELLKLTIPFSLRDIQGLATSHYTEFKDVFVTKNKLVTESEYEQVITLVEAIPGATTTQLIVALGTIAKKNALGGVVAQLAFCLPSALVLLMLGTLYRQYPDPYDINILVLLAIQGIKASTVALILQLCIQMIMKHIKGKLHLLISIVSGITILYYQTPITLIVTMILGGISLLMIEYDVENNIGRRTFAHKDIMHRPSTINDNNKYITFANCHKVSVLLGNKSFHLYGLILIGILYLNSKYYNLTIDISLSFFKIGTLIIGGTPITLPFMYAETVVNPLYINADAFWLGFGLSAALPGPYLNFAIFLGAHSMGPLGGICCWIAIFVPSFLQIWGLLPHWHSLRNNAYFNKFKDGIICSAIGFLGTAVYHSWVDACRIDAETATIITFLSLVYLILLNFNCPGVLTLGAVLFIVRYLALWYYRELDPIIIR